MEDRCQKAEDGRRRTDVSLSASLKIGQFNREIDFGLVEFIKTERTTNVELRNSACRELLCRTVYFII